MIFIARGGYRGILAGRAKKAITMAHCFPAVTISSGRIGATAMRNK
jgi:hypothetical protein